MKLAEMELKWEQPHFLRLPIYMQILQWTADISNYTREKQSIVEMSFLYYIQDLT